MGKGDGEHSRRWEHSKPCRELLDVAEIHANFRRERGRERGRKGEREREGIRWAPFTLTNAGSPYAWISPAPTRALLDMSFITQLRHVLYTKAPQMSCDLSKITNTYVPKLLVNSKEEIPPDI